MNFIFPSNFVYWNKIENHNEIKKEYYPKILNSQQKLQRKNKWLAKCTTSFGHEEENNIFANDKFLNEVVWKSFDDMLEKNLTCYSLPSQSYLYEVWFNTYKEGDFQEVHDHQGANFIKDNAIHAMTYSAIYLMHLEEKNKTVFYQTSPCPGDYGKNNFCYTTEHIEEGNIIFFPSNLLHYVLPCSKNRCTVSFNIMSVYHV